MKMKILACCTTTLLSVAVMISFGSTVPFEEDFEGFGVGAEISGTSDWSTTDVDTGAGVTGRALGSSVANSGSRGGALTNADLSTPFTDNDTTVFGTFYTRPFFGPVPDIPANSSVAFHVNESGLVVAYSNTTAVTLSHTPIVADTFVKFTVSASYSGSPGYSLYLNDSLIAANFGFYSTSNSDFNAFQVRMDAGTNATYLDDINIGNSSPFFQIVSNPVVGASQVRLYVGDASANGIYEIIKRDLQDSSFSTLVTDTNTGGADPFPIVDPSFVSSPTTTRLYKVVNNSGLSSSTNDTTWIAQKHFRGSNQWHMLSVPANNGTSADNTLAAFAGEKLGEGLTGNNTEASAPKLYVAGAGWNERYLDAGGIWRNAGGAVAATDNVDPGEGVWIKTVPPTSPPGEQTGYVTGQTHTNSVAISLAETNWVLISWPFASRQLNTAGSGATEYGWGLANAGVQAGVTYATASRMFAEDGGVWYNLFLFTNSKWRVQNTTADANVGLEVGNAYYIYNAGSTVNFTADPAN